MFDHFEESKPMHTTDIRISRIDFPQDNRRSRLESTFNLPQKSVGFETTCLAETEVAAEVMQFAANPTYNRLVRNALKMESQSTIAKKTYTDLQSLPPSQYLELTIVPILVNGLTYVTKNRPKNAIKALATFLLLNRSKYEEDEVLELRHHITKSRSAFASALTVRTHDKEFRDRS